MLTIKKLMLQTFADIRKVIATNRKVVVRIDKVVVQNRKPFAHFSKGKYSELENPFTNIVKSIHSKVKFISKKIIPHKAGLLKSVII